MPSTSEARSHGSVLVIAMILLAVLSIIGAAAVSLSSQERVNASAQTRVDFLNACANAAQAKIWAEMAQFGLGYLGSTVSVSATDLPNGVQIAAPAHYGIFDATIKPSVKNVFFKVQSAGKGDEINERDCTNGACGLTPLGQTYGMTAVCVDHADREYEVELAVKFAL